MANKKISIGEYRKRLLIRHGENFINDMDEIFTGDVTLTDVGLKYNISRMMMTKIFKRLYGICFRDVTKSGFAKDKRGIVFNYKPVKNKRLVLMVPESLYDKLKVYSKSYGVTMSQVVRERLYYMFRKDGMIDSYNLFE